MAASSNDARISKKKEEKIIMSRKTKNIYEELVLEGIAKHREELRKSISPMEKEMDETEEVNRNERRRKSFETSHIHHPGIRY